MPYFVRSIIPLLGALLLFAVAVVPAHAQTPTVIEIVGSGLAISVRSTQQVNGPVDPDVDTVNYGDVEVGRCAERFVRIGNLGRQAVVVDAEFIEGSAPDAFDVARVIQQVRIEAYDSIDLPIRFCPIDTGTVFATFVLVDHTRPIASARIAFKGHGVHGELAVPDSIHIDVNVPGCNTQPVIVQNRGNRSLVLMGATIENISVGFSFTDAPPVDLTIPPGQFAVIGMQFCADAPGIAKTKLQLTYRFDSDAPKSRNVTLTGEGHSYGDSLIRISRSALDFGDVAIGSCKRDSFVIANSSPATVIVGLNQILQKQPSTVSGPIVQLAPDSARFPLVLQPNDTVHVIVEYCPQSLTSDSALWISFISNPSTLQYVVPITGRGVFADTARVWMDRNRRATVGVPVQMPVHLADVAGRGDVFWDSLVIVADPSSIILESVVARNGSDDVISVANNGDSVFTIRRIAGSMPISGDTVLLLRFVGLTSGRPLNYVTLRAIGFAGFRRFHVDSIGSILLEGCDVGRDINLTMKGAIGSVSADRSAGQAVIRYHAPEGSEPEFVLYDAAGNQIRVVRDELSNGGERNLQFPLDGVAPGFYVIEMRAGDDRISLPILISR